MKRIFKYQDQTWEDPGEEYSNEEVRRNLAASIPEIASASIKETTLDDGRVQVEFIKRAGTKA